MKVPTSKRHEKTAGLLLFILFFLMIILAAAGFVLSLKDMVDKRTNYMIDDAVQQYAKTFGANVEAKLSATVTVADILSGVDGNDTRQIYNIIENAARNEEFDLVALSDVNGLAVTNTGDIIDVSEQDYFKRAIGGEKVVSKAAVSTDGKSGVLMISVPMRDETGVIGVLSCGYGLSQLARHVQKPRYFGEAYGMVFSGDYEVISWEPHRNAMSGGAGNGNLLKSLENGKLIGGMTVEQLKSNIADGMSGSFTMEYAGERRLVSYTPLYINDWYAFCFAPLTIYNRETAEVWKIVLLLIAELVLALGMLFFYILRTNRRHSRTINAANRRYEVIISNICGGVEISTFSKTVEESTAVYVSPGFTELAGYTLEEINSLFDGRVCGFIYEKDIDTVNRHLSAITDDNREYNMEYRIVCKDGRIVWVMNKGKIIEVSQGVCQCHSVLTDISIIKQQQEALIVSEERFRIAIESADNIMFDYDNVNGVYVDFANSRRMLGKTKEQINADLAYTRELDETARTTEIARYFYHPDDFDTVFHQTLTGFETGEVYYDARVHGGTGGYIWCRIHLTILNDIDGFPYRILGFMSNIDVIKQQAELFRTRSEKDALTGFYNKAATISLVNDAINNDGELPYTMFVMDIDNFKTINDTMGHLAGDAVIAGVAERLRAIFRVDDILGRVGGDEFVVLIRGVSETEHIIRKANEIINAFNTMSINAGGFFSVSVSIGIEVCPGRSNYEESFMRADKALYQAKRSGKNQFVFYDKSLSDSNCYTCNNMRGMQGR